MSQFSGSSNAPAAKLSLAGQTAAIASTPLLTAGSAGVYRVSVASYVSVVGTAGTMDVQISANNGAATQVYGYGTFTGSPGTQSMSGLSYRTQVYLIHVAAGQAISYSTVFSGVTGAPQYGLDIIVEKLN